MVEFESSFNIFYKSTLMCLMNNPICSFFFKNSAPPILPIRDYMFIKYENFEK